MEDLARREALLRDSRVSLERLLRLGTSDLDSRETEIARLVRELTEREQRLKAAETDVARRREELGAVELRRAALERRERALEERELELEEQARPASTAEEPEVLSGSVLVFVPSDRYRLREADLQSVTKGSTVALDDGDFVVARIGVSPLPGDSRRCAFLLRGPRTTASPDGSS